MASCCVFFFSGFFGGNQNTESSKQLKIYNTTNWINRSDHSSIGQVDHMSTNFEIPKASVDCIRSKFNYCTWIFWCTGSPSIWGLDRFFPFSLTDLVAVHKEWLEGTPRGFWLPQVQHLLWVFHERRFVVMWYNWIFWVVDSFVIAISGERLFRFLLSPAPTLASTTLLTLHKQLNYLPKVIANSDKLRAGVRPEVGFFLIFVGRRHNWGIRRGDGNSATDGDMAFKQHRRCSYCWLWS